jgi:hypothetical protein
MAQLNRRGQETEPGLMFEAKGAPGLDQSGGGCVRTRVGGCGVVLSASAREKAAARLQSQADGKGDGRKD